MTIDADTDGLEAWLTEGYARAYRTACLILRNPADAAEAVQEAYLRAWRFRHALPDGPGRQPWLYRVLVNTCYSRLRQEIPRRDRSAGAEPLAHLAGVEGRPEPAIEVTEQVDAVRAALDALPAHLKVVVVLRYWSGLSEREIATAIDRRPGTVKSRLHDAKRRLAVDPALRAVAPQEVAR